MTVTHTLCSDLRHEALWKRAGGITGRGDVAQPVARLSDGASSGWPTVSHHVGRQKKNQRRDHTNSEVSLHRVAHR